MSNNLPRLLGMPETLTWNGRRFDIEPLDLFDAAVFQKETGISFWEADFHALEHQSIILWLILRKADVQVTDAQREARTFPLTKREFGRLFPLNVMAQPKFVEFALSTLQLGGVMPTDEEAEDEGSDPNPTGATDSTLTS